MKLNWKTATCFLAAIILTTLLVIKGQKQVEKEYEPDVSQFPTLDYSHRKVLTEKQKARSKKYNSKQSRVITEDTTQDSTSFTSDWSFNLPALPVKVSSTVIIADVTDAQAYLSDDETKIYSEFVVQIHRVLKNEHKAPLKVGDSVVLERSGGRVRFPSGKIALSVIAHQDMPRIGRRYLFFLTHNGPDHSDNEGSYILTGYELRDGRVFPLDKQGAGHPGNSYKGTSEMLLLNDLSVALADTSLTPTR
jgi:hypothetical protein